MWKHPREGESVGCQNRFGNIGCCSIAITGTSGSLLRSTTVTLYRPTGRTCGDQNVDGSDEKSFQIGSTGGNQVYICHRARNSK